MRDLGDITELPELTDGVLRLRPWRAADAAAVTAVCDDASVSRWMPGMPHPYTLTDGEEWVGDAARKWAEERWANFAVEIVADGALVGSCGLQIDATRESAEVGYLVAATHRRRGIATACVRLLTAWALDELGLGRLQARADVRNVASRRTLTAAGYRFEGVLRGNEPGGDGGRVDDAVFSRLPDDPADGAGGAGRRDLGWPRFEDGRVVVRPFEPGDAPAVATACDDPDIAHWIHLLPSPYRRADAEAFIAEARHRLLLGDRARLAVVHADDATLLGSVSLDLAATRQAGEMGYWVARPARRRGVALAAARLMLRWAFDELQVARLEILTYPGNTASQALAARLGFRREALLHGYLAVEPGKPREGRVMPSADGSLPARDDQVLFALLRDEWAG